MSNNPNKESEISRTVSYDQPNTPTSKSWKESMGNEDSNFKTYLSSHAAVPDSDIKFEGFKVKHKGKVEPMFCYRSTITRAIRLHRTALLDSCASRNEWKTASIMYNRRPNPERATPVSCTM